MIEIIALRWGVKESLLRYIQSLSDGEISLVEPALWDGALLSFPLDRVHDNFDEDSLSGEIHFSGQALLSGHWGAMRIEFVRPEIHLVDGVGELRLAQLGLFDQRSSFPMVNLQSQGPDAPWTFDATLTAEGRLVLGEQYEVGELLSPVFVDTV